MDLSIYIAGISLYDSDFPLDRMRIYRSFLRFFTQSALAETFETYSKKSTAIGLDGISTSAFRDDLEREIEIIRKKVFGGDYKFTKYKEKLISKGAKRVPRLISIPTQRDRLVLRTLCDFLVEIFPDAMIKKPHGYVKRIRDYVQTHQKEDLVFVRMDVQEFYPSIRRDILLKIIRKKTKKAEILNLIMNAISTPTEKNLSELGVPQGLSVSNILASIYLMEMDRRMNRRWNYFRYVDDILIICPRSEAEKAFIAADKQLKNLKLNCHPLSPENDKTSITDAAKGVNYLGFHITPSKISIRKASFKKIFKSILGILTAHKFKANEGRLIWRLNLKITGCYFEGKRYGWMFFFALTEDIKQLRHVDHFVYQEFKKRGILQLHNRVQSLTRAYYEIRYSEKANCVPDFDNFGPDQMAEVIAVIEGKDIAFIKATYTGEWIKDRFFMLIRREVTELERDLHDVSS